MTEAENLKKAHAHLVKQRRSIIEALAREERGQTEIIDQLLKYQAAIELLDALADEDEEDEEDDNE